LETRSSRFESIRPANLLRRIKRFRIRRHHVHHVSLATVALIAIAVFFVLGAVLRLAMGPVSLGPFSDQLRESVLHALPGLEIKYDDAALEWSRDEGRVNLIIVGARVLDDKQHIVAQAPQAEIGLSANALLAGNVEIQRITLVGVQLTLVRTKEGVLRLGVEGTSEDVLQHIRDAIAKSGNGTSTLQRFAVRRARLAFSDEGTGLFLVAPQANVEVANVNKGAGSQLIASVDAAVEVTGTPAHVLATIHLPQGKGNLSGDISVTGLQLTALARNSKQFAFLQPFDLRTDLSGAFVVGAGNTLRSADLSISAAGIVGGFGSPLTIRSLRVVGRYDGATGSVLIDDADLQGENASAHAQGSGKLVFASDGSLANAGLDVKADKITLLMPAAFQQSVNLGSMALRGTYTTADRAFTIDQMVLSDSPLSGELRGRIAIAQGHSPEIGLNGTINPLSVRDLVRYWPLRVGEDARAWIAENISAGRVGPISIKTNIGPGQLDAPALPESAIDLQIPISGASVTYVKGMTPLTQVRGTAVLTGDTFKAQIGSGRLGTLVVQKGAVVIPQLHRHGTVGDIAATVSGAMRDVLKILDEKPLQYPTRFHIKPSDAAGSASINADFHVPMVKGIGIDQIPIAVKATTTGLVLAIEDKQFSNGNLVLDVDNSHLHAVGSVSYGRIPLGVEWTELFKAPTDTTTKLIVRGTLNDEARAILKLHLSDLLSGPVGVVATLTGHRGTIRTAQATVDLTPATVTLNPISYVKPPGRNATAQVSARFDANGDISGADVGVSGSGLSAQGTLAFSADGTLAHAEFPGLRAGPANDFALTLTQAPSRSIDVYIRGKSADGSAMTKEDSGGGNANSPESSAPYHVVARLDRFVLKENTILAPFSLDANTTGSRIQSLSLSTGTLSGDSVTASVVPAEDGRHLTINATDAGALLKGVVGLSNISGGRLTLSAKMPSVAAAKGVTDYAGTLTIRDFKIENQPFFARLFSAGSLGGLLDLMRGSGIVIDRLEMPFTSRGQVINIHDAHAAGPSIGLSGDGYIDRKAKQIDLRGAVAPVYGLNSVLGALPVLGNVLVSKPGEGIFGVTYEASGNLEEPNINVNPLSMLTPGILRRIFEGRVPTAPSQTSPNAPSPRTPPQSAPH
jgi:hypothetical protein